VQLIIKGDIYFLFLYYIKDTDDALLNLFLDFFNQTFVTSFSFRYHMHIHHRRDYEQKSVAVANHHYQGCQLNTKHASTQKYLRCLGNLCWSAAYNQGRLTLNF